MRIARISRGKLLEMFHVESGRSAFKVRFPGRQAIVVPESALRTRSGLQMGLRAPS
jgi:hypothetical protein